MALMGREFQFARQQSSRSDRSDLIVLREGQQYFESRRSGRDAAGAWMTAVEQRP
jgi:hypothetical protein